MQGESGGLEVRQLWLRQFLHGWILRRWLAFGRVIKAFAREALASEIPIQRWQK
jgi:hypothetical protein